MGSVDITEDILQVISENKLIIAYMERKEIPSMDDLLDRRILVKEMFCEGFLDKNWYQAEILAVDFLLSKHK